MNANAANDALDRLAEELRAGDGELGAMTHAPDEAPVYGPLVADGPRAAAAPQEYALAIEAIREGYLLHYGEPRITEASDPDLALLAGDYLYALGLSRLAVLGDTSAVAELAELISDCAALHAADEDSSAVDAAAEQRWQLAAKRIGG